MDMTADLAGIARVLGCDAGVGRDTAGSAAAPGGAAMHNLCIMGRGLKPHVPYISIVVSRPPI